MKRELLSEEGEDWVRDPFFGGCNYHCDCGGLTITGYYPTSEFEGSCMEWFASNIQGRVFETAEAAMNAALVEYFKIE